MNKLLMAVWFVGCATSTTKGMILYGQDSNTAWIWLLGAVGCFLAFAALVDGGDRGETEAD